MKSQLSNSNRNRFFSKVAMIVGLYMVIRLMTPLSAVAHIFWLEPENFHPKIGDSVQITLRVGDHFKGETRPYIRDWFTKFSVADPKEEHPVTGELGDDPAGVIKIRTTGVHVISFHGTPGYVKLKPKKFHTYLRRWGLERIIKLREEAHELKKESNEAFSRCAKTLLDVDSRTTNVGFDQNLKCTLELIPENNPYLMKPGDSIRFRLLYKNEPVVGALVAAITKDRPEEVLEVRTDQEGRGAIVLPTTGEWLLNGVHMIRSPYGNLSDDQKQLDWHSYWASLLFKME